MAKKNRKDFPLNDWIVNCEICGETILRNQWFCNNCGPPESKPKSLHVGISGLQAFLRVFLMIILFFSFAIYKLDRGGFEEKASASKRIKLEEDEEKIKLVHLIGVQMANVRNEPNGEIVMVLHEGEKIEVISNNGAWLEIKAHRKSGWIHENLVTSSLK